MIIDALNAGARDTAYIERSERLCSEMDTYEIKENGSYGAVEGCNDDLVVATAGCLWLAMDYMEPVKSISRNSGRKQRTRKRSEVDF